MNIKKILTALGMIGLLTAGAVRAQAPEAAQVQQDSLIAVDTVLKDGIRFIQSRDFEIYRGWTTGAAFNLSYADRPGDTTPYRLNITFAEGQFTMAAGQTKLMLKLKKAKIVMELINTRNIGPSDYRSELTKDGTYYYITPSFAISETQIQQIAADKVVKMRLIHDKGKFDREIQNNAAAVGFRAAYEAIQQRLEMETAAEPAIETKPVAEEESYGYIVDEEDGVKTVAGETMAETVEVAVEATESVEAVTAETEVETMEQETETTEAVETVETEVGMVEEAVESTAVAETETEIEAVEEAVESAEAVETEEPATETIVKESETPESTETTETVTDNAETEADSVETAIETEN